MNCCCFITLRSQPKNWVPNEKGAIVTYFFKALYFQLKGDLNMKIRKMLVALCMVVPLVLSACSGGSGDTGQQNADMPQKENAVTDVTPSVDETEEMDFDMGGRVIKWASWYDESIKEDNPDGIKKKQKLDELMKKHNFEIEYVVTDFGEYQNKVTASLIAGEPIGDIVRVARPWMIPSLTKLDLFWPVDEYTKNDKVFLQPYTKDYSNYNGKGYGFRAGILGASMGVHYNRTLMTKLGIAPLQDYVNNDTWNWDNFIKVAKEANKDTNNDGKLDTWGLATDSIITSALASNNANLVYGDKQGLDDPKTMEVLSFLSRLATEKVSRPTEGGDYTEPKQFFLQGNTLLFVAADYEAESFIKDMPDYDIGFLPFPKGPSEKEYQGYNSMPNFLAIPKAVKNPEQLLYIYEKMNDIESIYDYPQQAAFEKYWTNEDDINNAKLAGENIRVVETKSGYPNMPYYELTGDIRAGISISTVVEKYKAQFQSAIDEVWEK